jgi:sulfate permease, SulP family
LRGYQIGWLPRDLVAGLMLAVIRTAGDSAVGGDAARNRSLCICCRITCFAAFGANRFTSVAADSTIAPIFAGARIFGCRPQPTLCGARYAAHTDGRCDFGCGRSFPGRLAADPVTIGFLAGISIHIIVGGELPTLLGIPEPRGLATTYASCPSKNHPANLNPA